MARQDPKNAINGGKKTNPACIRRERRERGSEPSFQVPFRSMNEEISPVSWSKAVKKGSAILPGSYLLGWQASLIGKLLESLTGCGTHSARSRCKCIMALFQK
jgi:hypothetical protein